MYLINSYVIISLYLSGLAVQALPLNINRSNVESLGLDDTTGSNINRRGNYSYVPNYSNGNNQNQNGKQNYGQTTGGNSGGQSPSSSNTNGNGNNYGNNRSNGNGNTNGYSNGNGNTAGSNKNNGNTNGSNKSNGNGNTNGNSNENVDGNSNGNGSKVSSPKNSKTESPASTGKGQGYSSADSSLDFQFKNGQCTDWADARYHQLSGHHVEWKSDALNWANDAKSKGWTVSSSPKSPCIIVLQPGAQGTGGIGHVAVVESIESDGSVYTSNYNFNGGPYIKTYASFKTGNGVDFIWR
ncbi:hypothetical protein K7432_005504 [Basidiobolus ranarum]|uniref:Peptidase C51 domain-containing protein n=1 Tax=Basidiobolus ranarum TaxID=34480 RepID=A0ABR2W433_9FUNG